MKTDKVSSNNKKVKFSLDKDDSQDLLDDLDDMDEEENTGPGPATSGDQGDGNLTHSLTHSHTYFITLTYSLTHSLTHSLV